MARLAAKSKVKSVAYLMAVGILLSSGTCFLINSTSSGSGIEITLFDTYSRDGEGVKTFRDGKIVNTRMQNNSDSTRHNWVGSPLLVTYHLSVQLLATKRLKEILDVPRDEYGERDFLPGWLILDDLNAKTRDVLVSFSGLKQAGHDPQFPGVAVSQFSTNSLYLFHAQDSSLSYIGDDSDDHNPRNRDDIDSLFRGLRNAVFDENNGDVFYMVNGKARRYEQTTGKITEFDQYDCIAPVRNSHLLIAYSLDSNAYIILSPDCKEISRVPGPRCLQICTAHFVDNGVVVAMLQPRTDPATPYFCICIDFENNSTTRLGVFDGCEILDARRVSAYRK